jgi:hypothetical protein
MQSVELEQFLIDCHPQGDQISIDSNWLQSKLLEYNRLVLSSLCKDKEIETLRSRIMVLEASIDVYETIRSKQRYLNVKG